MAQIDLKGTPLQTNGELPQPGDALPDFVLTRNDLSDVTAADFAGKTLILNIFTSYDTSVCAQSVRTFLERTAQHEDVVVLNISEDLPFAGQRFCAGEGLANAVTVSSFRSTLPADLGVQIVDPPLKGLCARAVVVAKDGTVVHTQLVTDHVTEPDYDAALAAL